uniref:T9SS type A sorting domain-containing protein n=1 Tax=Ignavibacterium album TaxID=591197 RepID=A0A832DGT1_9BACT
MKLFLSLFLFTTISFTQSSEWIRIQTPVTANLKYIYAVDSLNIWVAGDSGYILYSSDLGENWSIQHFNSEFEITDIFFLDKDNGWAIENGTLDSINVTNFILSTTDGGLNWNSIRFRPDNVNLYSICFRNYQTGFIGGDNSVFVITTNSGTDWIEIPRDTATFSHFPVRKIRFLNDSTGFAVGGFYDRGGVIWHSIDGGFNWMTDSAYADPFFDMVFVDSVSVVAMASDIERSFPSAVFKTTNLGNSWFHQEIPYYGVSTGIDKRTSTEIWGTFKKEFIVSTDAGENWFTVVTPDSIEVYDIAFTDSLHGFAVAQNGIFLRYIPKVISVNDDELKEINSFFVYQNYPNPFNSSTRIKIQFLDESLLNIFIYNSLGEKVHTVFSGISNSGVSEYFFSAENLPSGIYFYTVEAIEVKNRLNSNFFTGKMILLK